MKKRILVPYVAATLAMAASISVAARDGAVVARSYMNYNDQKPSVAAEYRYQTVGISTGQTLIKLSRQRKQDRFKMES